MYISAQRAEKLAYPLTQISSNFLLYLDFRLIQSTLPVTTANRDSLPEHKFVLALMV
jgi:hypothetical protein